MAFSKDAGSILGSAQKRIVPLTFLLCGLLLLLVGLSSRWPSPQKTYGLMIDAGSTGGHAALKITEFELFFVQTRVF